MKDLKQCIHSVSQSKRFFYTGVEIKINQTLSNAYTFQINFASGAFPREASSLEAF